jgi:hypothetical protein
MPRIKIPNLLLDGSSQSAVELEFATPFPCRKFNTRTNFIPMLISATSFSTQAKNKNEASALFPAALRGYFFPEWKRLFY